MLAEPGVDLLNLVEAADGGARLQEFRLEAHGTYDRDRSRVTRRPYLAIVGALGP